MSDNQEAQADGSEIDASQAFVNADVFYSEPDELTDDEEAGGDTQDELSQSETDEEQEGDDKQSTVKYEYDDEAGTYSFKSNGEAVEANIEKLIENFSKGEGFTKKTTDLANKDKARAKEHSEALAGLKTQEDQVLALAESIRGFIEPEQNYLDELRDSDPSEYLKQKELVDKRKAEITQAKEKILLRRKEELQVKAKSEFDTLKKVMDWDTQEKVTKGFQEISDYCLGIGMEANDIKDIYSHKLYQALSDAAKYQKLVDSKDKVTKEVKAVPKSVKSKKTEPQKEEKTAAEVIYGT